MARKLNQELRETWQKRVDGQRRSGMSVAAFCRQEGVSTANFYVWKGKLQAERPRRRKKATAGQKTVLSTGGNGKAQAKETVAPFVQLPVPAPAASPWIEVVLAEGTVVRLPQQNLAALQTVLRALSGAPTSAIGEVRYA